MSAGIQLIVGLGNPGAEYEKTRHNAGAWFVAELAQAARVSLRRESKYQGLHAIFSLHHHECHLLIPTTYMNHSGQSITALANYYKIPPTAILVAHDDIDLPIGDIRLKFEGGHGGHNGLRDIIDNLGSNQFYRLRIGVGHPGNSKDVHDYVLHPPKKTELASINAALTKAHDVLPMIIEGHMQKAMQALHTNK